jgi:Exo-beta-D-glucosaminidase Ig-fold domain/Glycosyl hydrolases family 2/F5/8 type C domain/Glycosyl hydrolases family 2, sugar binding domain
LCLEIPLRVAASVLRLASFVTCCASLLIAQQAVPHAYTRGLGVYPGDPKQYDGPALVAAPAGLYRNLALHRPAYQSSAYDYNLTAQLVTDGIKETVLPGWITTSTSTAGELPKNERELFLDGNPVSSVTVSGSSPWVEFDLEGSSTAPTIDRADISLRKINSPLPAAGWDITITGSNDKSTWQPVASFHGTDFGEQDSFASFKKTVPFQAAANFRSYRVTVSIPGIPSLGLAEITLFHNGNEVRVTGPDVFSSAWMSAGSNEEWVSVDLGAVCAFDRIKLDWIRRAAEGEIQISDDGKDWKTLQSLTTDDVHLASPAHAQWIRVRMTKPSEPNGRYILSELEVWGRGGVVPAAKPTAVPQQDNTLRLAAGKWRLQRASQVTESGEQLSNPAFADKDWMIATVPGTVLTSYLNDGAIPNPDFADNQYAISDSYFCADFWYRDEFTAPGTKQPGKHYWLNFDGINWKAEVYLNGQHVGRIDGGYMRGRFDVTALIHPGAANALAVRILHVDNPGSTKDKAGRTLNGGALGRDNPTYHASAGWDWISTIRGRDTGIWSDVTLTTSGEVTIENPLVTSKLPLPDTSQADVTIQASIRNQESHPVSGTLHAQFGAITVETHVTVDASSTKIVEFNPTTHSALHIANPKLWWPVGYGDPNLYPVKLTFIEGSKISDTKSFNAGIRQFAYSEDGEILHMWINGRRFIARGGNWGFPESMLRYRAREYDTAMRYHRDQHFNMVRNWVGQTGDEAFYDAADRFGIVVWQDFWLANPWDGPNPDHNDFFLTVARDYLLRIRNHASLGLFCGRNEGFPPQQIDDGLRSMTAELSPGSHYISSSADGPVSGHGPYRVEPLKVYFSNAPKKFHSEIGSPNVPELEILRHTISEEGLWPQSKEWPLHDFHDNNPFATQIDKNYGGAKTLEEWTSLAQFVDYNSYRGMFESQSNHRYGLLIWMSHPAWPSILWQTYDYFFDTDAAYYAAKKAAEPLHIQWNANDDTVEVVNYSAGPQTGLTAHAELLGPDGAVLWQNSASLDSTEDSTTAPIKMQYPAASTGTLRFIRLTLQRGGKTVSSNFYLYGGADEDFTGIRKLASAQVSEKSRITQTGAKWTIDTELHNVSQTPALMVRVKAVRAKTGDVIAPALYDDNYIALMPGESRTIHIELEDADTRGERPRVIVSGFNVSAAK